MNDIPESAWNVLRGLTGDGLTRIEEAESEADTDAERASCADLRRRIGDHEHFPCDCHECGVWDGVHRRCCCGNRRVYWEWNEKSGRHRPEVY